MEKHLGNAAGFQWFDALPVAKPAASKPKEYAVLSPLMQTSSQVAPMSTFSTQINFHP